MNNTILVPTDFSSNAWVAIEYAAQLGLDKKKKLVLLHAFNPFYSSFTSMEHNLQMLEETEKIVNAEMELISEKLKSQYPTLEFECLCLEGNLNEVIVRESKDNLFDLIVMGTKGATGLVYALMGSNTFDVINKSQIPVLAVPNESVYNLQKVGVLSNYKNSEIAVLTNFIKIVGKEFSAVLLHVHEEANGFEQAYAEAWKELVKDETGLQDLSYNVGRGDKVREVVNKMMEEEKVDLLLVTNNAKSFIKSLFGRDIVKSLALKPQVPILFIKA
jgi:nucleotide-binding universal stress UspA family protein